VLIIDSSRNSAKMLAEIVRSLGASEFYVEPDGEAAWDRLSLFDPNLIFCEYSESKTSGTGFVRRLRRSNSRSRKVPVVMMATGVTKTMLDEARDTGADEFMLKPYARRDVERRAAAVLLNARPWIEAVDYIGPDRRRFNSSEYKGARRRKADNKTPVAGLEQAVRILVSSVGKLEEDRSQALRSILTQLEVIVPAMRAKDQGSAIDDHFRTENISGHPEHTGALRGNSCGPFGYRHITPGEAKSSSGR